MRLNNQTMTEKFRLENCRFCLNRKFDFNKGVWCSLQPLPEVVNGECNRMEYDDAERKKFEKGIIVKSKKAGEESFNGYWKLVSFVIPLIILALFFFKNNQLNTDFRWTVGVTKNVAYRPVFSAIPIRKFLYYDYLVNGKTYEGRIRVDFDTPETRGDGLIFFVRYSESNPDNSTLHDLQMAPYFLKPEDIPYNGIAADSLKSFVQKLKQLKSDFRNR